MRDKKIMCSFKEMADPKKLKPHPSNPNQHPENQLHMLGRSITEYGWRHPVIVSSRSGFIVAGHARREVAIRLKCKVPIDMQDFESEEEEIAVLLADNILPELSTLDEDLLSIGKDLMEAAEINLETIGIDDILRDIDEQNTIIEKQMNIEERELKPYTKTHLLISFEPGVITEVMEVVESLSKIEGVEIEQGNN